MMDYTCLCLLFICISYVSSTKLHYDPRVTVKKEGITRFSFENKPNINLVKLVSSGKQIIWVGGNESLYSIITTQASSPHQVNMNLCHDQSKDSETPHCSFRISLLRESVDRNLLFICTSDDGNTKCCNLDSSYSQIDCFVSENYEPDINEPSLLDGNMLYFTKSEKGLYRINKNDKNDNIWSQSTQAEQTYLKLIAGKGQHQDKVYSFFAEKHKSRDGESEQWIPRVSQSCKNDRGGSKSLLQSSWTSMIFSRLFCGRGYEFTQMIDVATLETDSDAQIYVLFRNYWNMSAVCVYNMTEISTVFNSSKFNSGKVPANHRPGTCVSDSTRLSSEVLGFMKDRPEMKESVMPENGPMLFQHYQYTHIQVDRVRGQTVMLLSLESGGVHKVLEDTIEQPVFIIAEYLPFQQETHITSMLLDTSQKHLYVSSSNEVVQIDLKTCHVYGNECNECRLSRDPYCGWSGLHCTSAAENQVRDFKDCADITQTQTDSNSVIKAKLHAPTSAFLKEKPQATPSEIDVPPSSKHFLLCPVISHHATYHWEHDETRADCVQADNGCLYLIESMNKTHEGTYKCKSSEEDYINRTVVEYKLSMSRSDAHRLTPVLFPSFLLLLTVFHVLHF
ncbi:semaphorin-7A-like isoform X1 [Carassius auratus]|uniref:Semaphorin-7A-like isoform X1 n=1 Tax=Carassius auratus TaxID=7957 RepID=A0A6P6LRV2_CARAU|nr:semaphorin-7A-like isoform X1 [Carassius auratus]